jgi:hypothetical protein
VSAQPIRVVYIAGAGRSGSTLLSMLLGTLPGCVSIGELRHIWTRGVELDQLCGCGEPFRACPFWRDVGDRAFGGWDRSPHERMVVLQRRVDRFRRLPALAALRLAPQRRRLVDEYTATVSQVYAAIAESSGAGTIIDSSKSASFAMLLGRVPQVEPHLLHLVRDSRAVAHSWTRLRAMPEVGAGEEFMATFSPLKSAAIWLGNNAALDMIDRFTDVPGTRLRYESLVSGSQAELRKLASGLGLAYEDVQAIGGPTVPIATQHSVAGNPARFARGSVVLRPDEEWRRGMRRRDRRAVGLLTWPLLALYGYPLKT